MLASEGGAITWVAMHRLHHTLSDREGRDLHTPKDGFWWSHVGWIVSDIGMSQREIEARHAPELVADPVHRTLNRLHVYPNIFVGLALFAWGGWPYVVWGIFLRLVVGLNATWFVNSAAHTFGYRTYDTPEGSTNCWWVGIIAWGEGWHNNHHAFQRSARHGHEWWEVDATWALIRVADGARPGDATSSCLPKTADQYRLRGGAGRVAEASRPRPRPPSRSRPQRSLTARSAAGGRSARPRRTAPASRRPGGRRCARRCTRRGRRGARRGSPPPRSPA